MNPLLPYMVLSALLFSIGLAGVLMRRNAIVVLIGIELMLNAANLNFVAAWRHAGTDSHAGFMFALFAIGIAAAEVAVGLALVLLTYRHFKTTHVNEPDSLRG